MPNHVHILLSVFPGYELNELISSVMRFSATRINRHTGRNGVLWQEEPFDTLVRSYNHYLHLVNYIRENPQGLQTDMYQLGGLEFK